MAGATSPTPCVFCQIARNSASTQLLHSDEKVVAFQDIKPAAYRHYLVISVDHIPTVRDLQRRAEDYSLVANPLAVILSSETHVECWARTVTTRCSSVQSVQPPLNSVNHLHLHCLALPFIPRQVVVFGGFIEAEKLLEKIKPLSSTSS
ncbi:hypothetical protein WN944_013592 [Citrus x changshan-huyou]|uniref:HIT domain-containing protein n=1 Tax=Citrus x changshan-huyou TaxID=2935761 RepID=A0AAP0QI21_9ROSI